MSDRMKYIKPRVPAEARRVAYALRKVANALDAADDKRAVTFYTGDLTDENLSPIAHAWSAAALMIADTAEIDSITLRALAVALDRQVNHAGLF